MMDIMKPALSDPAPSYMFGFSLFNFLDLPARTKPIIPKINPTKKHENTMEQMPNTKTAVEFGKDCLVVILFFLVFPTR